MARMIYSLAVSLRKDLIDLSTFLERAAKTARAGVDTDPKAALLVAIMELYYGATRAMGIAATAEEREAALAQLTAGNRSGNARGMVTAERVRHSRGTKKRDALVVAANAKNYTLRSLAEAVDVSHALLSQARTGKRSIEADIAKKVENLTGFKATRANWPRLKS